MENVSQALESDTAMGTHHMAWGAQSGCPLNQDTVTVSLFAMGHQGPFMFISSLCYAYPICEYTNLNLAELLTVSLLLCGVPDSFHSSFLAQLWCLGLLR